MTGTFGKRKLIKDIYANSFQNILGQGIGLIIFYLTSKYLSKEDFGGFNWSMAVGTTIITISSLGLDVVFMKRVALGKDVVTISGIHFFHTLLTGIVLCSLVLLARAFFPHPNLDGL